MGHFKHPPRHLQPGDAAHLIDPRSIAHRVRCMTTRVGQVIRCPICSETSFRDFNFDGNRDPLPGNRPLSDPHDPEEVRELLTALIDMSSIVEHHCGRCSALR